MFGKMRDPVDGTATLVSHAETGRHHASLAVTAQIVLHTPGMEPQTVDINVRVPATELPLTAGEVWNVQFDRSEPTHVKFEWAVTDALDRDLRAEMEREMAHDEFRVLEASRRRASK